jgi:hypothetical protein
MTRRCGGNRAGPAETAWGWHRRSSLIVLSGRANRVTGRLAWAPPWDPKCTDLSVFSQRFFPRDSFLYQREGGMKVLTPLNQHFSENTCLTSLIVASV